MSRLKKVDKLWGFEEWIANNELYCGKRIFVKQKWSSKGNFHYHPVKDETFYVLEGVLQLDIGLENGWITSNLLHEGHTLRIKPGAKHRFRGYGGTCTFFEFSTQHLEEDSIRCYFDEEKKLWIDLKKS
jgi:mannose-6-phosphate isomerase-like protein (cupin superfamily)